MIGSEPINNEVLAFKWSLLPPGAHHFCEWQVLKMQFYALLEEWSGESIAFFRELPGCFVSAPTTEDALRDAPATIEQYFRWLKENHIVIVENEIHPIEVVLSEG